MTLEKRNIIICTFLKNLLCNHVTPPLPPPPPPPPRHVRGWGVSLIINKWGSVIDNRHNTIYLEDLLYVYYVDTVCL